MLALDQNHISHRVLWFIMANRAIFFVNISLLVCSHQQSQQIDLAWDSEGLEEFRVTFEYDYFTVDNASQFSVAINF
jgi:hypothetical protein